jgi:hypothetical protein
MKFRIGLAIATLLSQGLLFAQVGTISTGGLGGPGGFGARPVFAGRFGNRPFGFPPFARCCGPGLTVTFGHHPRAGIKVGGFSHGHFIQQPAIGFVSPFWDYTYDDGAIGVEREPEESGLPRQPVSHFEEHVPAAPLLLEREGDHWVRRRVVEAQAVPESSLSSSDGGDPSRRERPAPAGSGAAPHSHATRQQ